MTENTALAIRKQTAISTFDDVTRAAKAMHESGFFKDATSQAQAIVKILAGQELGFGAFASMNGIHIIQGKPSVGANLMAAAVKGSGRYNYRVAQMDDSAVELVFFEGKDEIGRSRFTKEDAVKAQTQNMGKFPRNMMFARAISNGVRWFCPDVFNGSAVYTPEELGATVDEDGDVIDAPYSNVEPAAPVVHDYEWAVRVKTRKGRELADLNFEQTSQLYAFYSKAKADGKNLDPQDVEIIEACEILLKQDEQQEQPEVEPEAA
jgi:hypothetical protein